MDGGGSGSGEDGCEYAGLCVRRIEGRKKREKKKRKGERVGNPNNQGCQRRVCVCVCVCG